MTRPPSPTCCATPTTYFHSPRRRGSPHLFLPLGCKTIRHWPVERHGLTLKTLQMGEATAARGFTVARHARAALLRPLSVRAHIVSLILVIVAPLLAFSAFLVLHSAASEQEVMASNVRARTREAVAAIDHELGALRSRLFTLAGSRHLQAEDFRRLRARNRGTEGRGPRRCAQQFQRPRTDRHEHRRRANRSGWLRIRHRSVASSRHSSRTLQISPGTRSPAPPLSPSACLCRATGAAHLRFLAFNIAPLLPRLITGFELPPDWLVTLATAPAMTVARSPDAGRFVGQMGRPAALERLRAWTKAGFPLVSREGIPIYNVRHDV